MNKYVLTLILKPDLEEKAQKELLSDVVKNLGKLEKEELWGNKDLAYPIQKQTKGYYAHYFFESEPSSISDLDNTLKLEENILRYLITRV